MDNILIFEINSHIMEAVVVNKDLLKKLQEQEKKAKKMAEAAIAQMEKENGKKYPK